MVANISQEVATRINPAVLDTVNNSNNVGHMYKSRNLQYINLPTIPRDIIEVAIKNIPTCISNAQAKKYATVQERDSNQEDGKTKFLHVTNSTYIWSDFENQALDAWCKQNICKDMYFGFQIMIGDVAIHKDIGTSIKFCYLIQSGGDNVITTFYDDDKVTPLDSYCIELEKWHILKVNTCHGVSNFAPEKVRFAVTGKIF